MKNNIIQIDKLGFQWKGHDPFLYCMHHKDAYPEGNDEMGPRVSLSGRDLGDDFSYKDGFSMYHGASVPGFPKHPHRGFETVTIVLKGYVDHADSSGALGRYGAGDVQWLTSGRGCNHSEMFPLLNTEEDNPLELFQIWLNLPSKDKFVEPHYKMLWAEEIPVIELKDTNKKISTMRIISGSYNNIKSLQPSPNSWAKDENNNVNIFVISMEAGALLELPRISSTLNRTLYYYSGNGINISETSIDVLSGVRLKGDEVIKIENGLKESKLLLLEGEPIGEPVKSYGPFVMNTEEEIEEAFSDYRETGFGGWQWQRDDVVHQRNKGRFAEYPDGTVEYR
ncbi:hypothetical protein BJV85_002504 [Clostridium acetobutylicum]|uniref:Uncharacterized protein, YhhW/pirin family n=2 Tax=Clostridium acetobutylicum TaxID=1488 RepID=Q97IZ4_CLOAB|nr:MULTISPECIES: pirin family protein [Clostridium]AAK79460.1 Uncharacterized protein, YhhW/pirin family [Clostridium acetobutylicum ATCC 824]ADZ20545.1 Conserved hypothetical protein [Clostridium acetobutylicum EA 2018]AEI34255.1 hypothetical protein SMB_G1517 [Clostridium acetobutylicum DSM 1731]AWV81294.1 pirin family protein [Clostridium acetobutylicum]MBC2392928.1 pirin family protein [Clostridium acetobutylicum]